MEDGRGGPGVLYRPACNPAANYLRTTPIKGYATPTNGVKPVHIWGGIDHRVRRKRRVTPVLLPPPGGTNASIRHDLLVRRRGLRAEAGPEELSGYQVAAGPGHQYRGLTTVVFVVWADAVEEIALAGPPVAE